VLIPKGDYEFLYDTIFFFFNFNHVYGLESCTTLGGGGGVDEHKLNKIIFRIQKKGDNINDWIQLKDVLQAVI
jgi:hypothetical protein